MPDENGDYNWEVERNWVDHDRLDREVKDLHASMVEQKNNVDKLLSALRELIERIPPENLE